MCRCVLQYDLFAVDDVDTAGEGDGDGRTNCAGPYSLAVGRNHAYRHGRWGAHGEVSSGAADAEAVVCAGNVADACGGVCHYGDTGCFNEVVCVAVYVVGTYACKDSFMRGKEVELVAVNEIIVGRLCGVDVFDERYFLIVLCEFKPLNDAVVGAAGAVGLHCYFNVGRKVERVLSAVFPRNNSHGRLTVNGFHVFKLGDVEFLLRHESQIFRPVGIYRQNVKRQFVVGKVKRTEFVFRQIELGNNVIADRKVGKVAVGRQVESDGYPVIVGHQLTYFRGGFAQEEIGYVIVAAHERREIRRLVYGQSAQFVALAL